MTLEFVCGNCGRELKADERSAGRRARCPQCDTLVEIPSPAKAGDELVELEVVADDAPALVELPPAAVRLPQPISPPPIATATNVEPQPAAPPIVVAPRKRKKSSPPTVPDAATAPVPAYEAPLAAPVRPHPEDLIDMTAMVDIVFFLLIFFLVTSLQSLEAVMNLPTPQAAEGGVTTGRSAVDLENDPNFITVRIEDDDSIWVEDTQVFNDQDLTSRLRALVQETDRPRGLLVLGSADASHGTAVRIFDAAAGAGLGGISLVVQEEQPNQ